ncbi:hypothetical protein MRB53_024468 [Persea americana]|uniref:Uncharacterized protein n=1 Tax=Persea americana TaxID=3435 RepID=A0ACC2LD08_PERAE|nr:hypothetical protein MRB53_024468 [Persea americana]
MPDMNGFELLEIVVHEMGLPAILTSANCDVNVAMRGLEHGALYYLMKPVSMSEVRNIWQHIIRKSKEEKNDIEEMSSLGETKQKESSSEENDKTDAAAGSGTSADQVELEPKKRKKGDLGVKTDAKGKKVKTAERKARILWDAVLHNKFVKAIDQIGIDRAVPKKILQLIDAPGLNLKNVASHLQKHRLFLRRLNETNKYGRFRSPSSKSRLKMHPLLRMVGGPDPTSISNFPSLYNPKGVQPTAASDMQNTNASMPMTFVSPAPFVNQDSQSIDPIATSTRLGQSNLPTNVQPMLQPGSISSAPSVSLLQQNNGSMGFGMFQQQMEMGSSSTSDTTHWPTQPSPGLLESAPLGNFGMQNAQNSDYLNSKDNMELINKFNQFSLSNSASDYTELQVTSAEDFNRMTQTGLLEEGLSNMNSGSNLMNGMNNKGNVPIEPEMNNKGKQPFDSTDKGKMPLVMEEEEDIFLPELTASDFIMDLYMNFDYSNQYPTDYPNVTQEDVFMGGNNSSYDMDTLLEQVQNQTFWNSSEDQPSGSSTNDMVFKQAQDGTNHKEGDFFDFNLFCMGNKDKAQ